MKILRVKLKNFASIYSGMSKKEIDIDFKKSRNKIILLVGKNGSGKTSLLSNLHPFPYVESIDVRNTQDLILDGKEGLKYLEIKDGKNKYEITINYLIQRDKRITRCFIKKNGRELNPSGLVRTYYDILKLEFNIEPSFLRILRLGPNVSDIISMKSTDRKDFISTFLSDIDIYQKLFGVIKEESTFVKNQMKVITSNYDKIDNIESLKSDFRSAKEDIERAKKLFDDLNGQLAIKQDQLAREVLPDDQIMTILTAWKAEEVFINKYNQYVDKAGDIVNQYNILSKEKMRLEVDLSTLESNLKDLSNVLAKSLDKLTDYENKLALIGKSDGVEDINTLIKSYQSKLKELGNPAEPLGTTEQFQMIKRIWKECLDTMLEIADIHVLTIYKELAHYQSESDILDVLGSAIDKTMADLSEKIALAKMDKSIKADITKGRIMYIPKDCKIHTTCPYYKAITEYHGSKSGQSLKALNGMFDYYLMAKNSLVSLKMVQKNIDMINGFHTSIQISFGEVFTHLINFKRDDLTKIDAKIESILSQSMDYELHESYIATIEDLKTRQYLANKAGGIEFIKAEIYELKAEIDGLKTDRDNISNKIDETKDSLAKLTAEFDEVSEIYDTINKYNSNQAYYNNLIANHELAVKSAEKADKINHEIWIISTNIQSAKLQVDEANAKATEIYYKIRTKTDLENQLNDIKDRFEYVEVIREALSSTKGIPLIFIQLYLKNIQILANHIIHEMFDESISLQDFVITDKEFSIPYRVNGIEIKDVAYSSQGERTTIVMALSFAMLQQFIGRYNILLLDEVDSALYKDNRRKFIKIVEDQMSLVGCEQAFLITHNALFENYPVDIIMTSAIDQSEYNRGNIIWSPI